MSLNHEEPDYYFDTTNNYKLKIKSKNEQEEDLEFILNLNYLFDKRLVGYSTQKRFIPSYNRFNYFYINLPYKYKNLSYYLNIRSYAEEFEEKNEEIYNGDIFYKFHLNQSIPIKNNGAYSDNKICQSTIPNNYNKSLKEEINKVFNLFLDPVSPDFHTKYNAPLHLKNLIDSKLFDNQILMYSKCIEKEKNYYKNKEEIEKELKPFKYEKNQFPNKQYSSANINVLSSSHGSGKICVALALATPCSELNKISNLKTNIITVENLDIKKWEMSIKKHYSGKYLIVKTVTDLKRLIKNPLNKSDKYYLDDKNFSRLIKEYQYTQNPTNRLCYKTKFKETKVALYLAKQDKIDIDIFNQYDLILITNKLYLTLANYIANQDLIVSRLFVSGIRNIEYYLTQIKASTYYYIESDRKSLLFPYGTEGCYLDEDGNPIINLSIKPLIKNYNCYQNSDYIFDNYIVQTFCKISESIKNKLLYFNKDSPSLKKFKKEWENIFIFSEHSNLYNFKRIISNNALYNEYDISLIKKQISDEVIESINNGNIEKAIKKMDIIKMKLDDIIKKSTNNIISKILVINDKIEEINSDRENIPNNQEEIIKLEKTKSELNTKCRDLDNRLHNINECPVCICDIENKVVLDCCKNVMCFSCIITSLLSRVNCPICRKEINVKDDLILISDDIMIEEEEKHIIDYLDFNSVFGESNLISKNENFEKLIKHIITINQSKNIKTKLMICYGYDNYNDNKNIEKIFNTLLDNNIRFENWYNVFSGYRRSTEIINQYTKEDLIDCLIISNKSKQSNYLFDTTTDIIFYDNSVYDEIKDYTINISSGMIRKKPLNVWQLDSNNEIAKL